MASLTIKVNGSTQLKRNHRCQVKHHEMQIMNSGIIAAFEKWAMGGCKGETKVYQEGKKHLEHCSC